MKRSNVTCKISCAFILATLISPICGNAETHGGPIDRPNTLTLAEEREGWHLLFDGVSLSEWRGYKGSAPSPGWVVNLDTLCNVNRSGHLATISDFSNFELSLEWKASNGAHQTQ